MEDNKNEVSETKESTNKENGEKKNAKAAVNQFVEKHGKKKCIIVSSVCGAAAIALILGLTLGLGGCDSKAPIVDAPTWKTRAQEIVNKHEDTDSDYKAPTKATVSFSYSDKAVYSDGVSEDNFASATYMIDNDNLIIYGKSNQGNSLSGDPEKIANHTASDDYNITSEYCFWVDEVEKRAYIVATQDSVTKSMYFLVTDEEIASVKTNPEQLQDLSEECQEAFDKVIGDDVTIKHYSWSDPGAPISYITYMYSPIDFYDEYYDDLADKGVTYISGGKYAANYTKKSLELRSSGKGNVSFAFSGTTNEDIKDYSETKVDDVKHISGDCSYELSYDNYNMTGYIVDRKASVNLTFDLTAELTFSQNYKFEYGTANIKKPEVKNLINTMA